MYGFSKPILGKLMIGGIIGYLVYAFFFKELRQIVGSVVGITFKEPVAGQGTASSQPPPPPAPED